MGRSPLLNASPFTSRRLIGGLAMSRNTRRRTSQEIKLQVVDSFRGAIKVRSLMGGDGDDDDENERAMQRHRYNNYHNKRNKIGWWEPPMECLPLDFCRDTSLHGLKYIGQPKRHMAERIFWFLAFMIGVFAAIYLSSDVWRKYKESPVIVTFESSETNIDKIPFPAVTICNMNKVLRSKAESYIASASDDANCSTSLKDVYNLDHVCTSSKSFSNRFNFTSPQGFIDKKLVSDAYKCIEKEDTSQNAIQSFLQEASQPCKEMIPLCIWQDKVIENCTTLFRPIETDFGKCCTFNMVPQTLLRVFQNDDRDDKTELKKWSLWNAAEGGLFPADEPTPRIERPRRQIRAGKSFGLSILLDPDLDEYFCTTSDSIGFRLSTHLPTETPHIVDFGIGINSNSEVFVDVRPEITTADPSIRNYDLEKRQCYFPGEIGLRFYNYYTVANCIDECVANVTYNNCNCTRFYMPRDNNQSLCGPGPDAVDCIDRVQADIADVGLKKYCDHCLPSCTEINYAAETTTTPMQNGNTTWTSDDITKSYAKWAGNSVSIIHIFFGTDSTYARVRKQLYGVTDLIANTGGLMGLCLGFSGLSAMEVLYFLSLRAWCRTRRKRTLGSRVAKKFRDLWTKIKAVNTYGHGHEKQSRENSMGQNKFGTAHSQSKRQQNRILPTVSISEYANPAFQHKVFTTTTTVDNNLPDYNSVVNEINPYYTNRYWRHADMKNELQN